MENKIIYAVTVSKSLKLLNGKIDFLNNKGFSTSIIASPGEEIKSFENRENTNVIPVEMKREISILDDVKSLFNLVKILAKEKPNIVNVGTPKAGLLVSIAALICRVPVRIYTIRGLRLETTSGLKKKILLITEKIAARSATHVICISPSLKKKVIDLNIVNPNKISLIGKGSSNGINISKYNNSKASNIESHKLRKKLRIKQTDFIIGFAGRLTNDKGIQEVLNVFERVSSKRENVKLLLLGDFEENDSISSDTINKLYNNPQILFEGYKTNLVPYYKIMDTFLFLSKREGFGNVVIEAALAGVPAVVGDVTGVKDTVINNITGFVVKRDNVEQCVEKIEFLIDNEKIKDEMGKDAIKWATENFDSKIIWEEYLNFYYNLTEGKG